MPTPLARHALLDPNVSDDDLVARASRGDTAAYGALFERHAPALRAYARRLTDDATADDLVAEAFVRTWQQLRAGAGPSGAFRAYLRVAVRNGHISRWRRAGDLTFAHLEDVAAMNPVPFAVLVDSSAEDQALEQLMNKALRDALHRLPRRWQEVLVMVYLHDLPYESVAARMNLTPPAARQLAQRARQAMRAELARDTIHSRVAA